MNAYLDYNATAPIKPEAAAAMTEAFGIAGNPSSVHRAGRRARRLVETAREQIAALVGADPAQVIFTSGGTEANNLALHRLAGVAAQDGAASGTNAGNRQPRVLVSAIEHDSVRAVLPDKQAIPALADGSVDLAALETLLTEARDAGAPIDLLAVMLANNETGVIQPIAAVAALAQRFGARLHCDAVQAAGKVTVDMQALGVDSLALSAHKIGGPQGVGALVLRPGVELAAWQRGGGQEFGRRAGTENVAGIAGFGVAAELAVADLPRIGGLAAWRDDLEARLARIVPGLMAYGAAAPRLPNTSCVAMPGVCAETQVMALDLAGIMVSAGAACSSGKVRASHVLEAMGADAEAAGSAIRISLGWRSEAAEIDRLVDAWTAIYRRAGSKPAATERLATSAA